MNKLILLLLMITMLNESPVHGQSIANFEWGSLPPIPNKIGFAGSFAGVANGALIVAGGSNFPDGGAPWTGAVKAWTDQIFMLETPQGKWKDAGKLPQKLGYGISINYKNSLILLGGSNEKGHHADVLMLQYKNGEVEISNLPKLPQPIANTCGVLLGDMIYVMGGIATPDAKIAGTNFWALDLAAKQKGWKILETWPGAGRMLSVAGAQNGSIYLFSGVELVAGQRKYLTDAYQYSTTKGWKKIANLPNSVAAAPTPAFAFGEKDLMIFGGDDGVEAPNAAVLREKHPGFSKQILSYNEATNSWAKNGDILATWAPVTTSLTVWNDCIILPGGEIRPATRTPNVLMAKPIKKN